MAPLVFTCPNIRKQAPTGIHTDAQSLRSAWSKSLKVQCPLCGECHDIAVRDTHIDFALDGAVERLGSA